MEAERGVGTGGVGVVMMLEPVFEVCFYLRGGAEVTYLLKETDAATLREQIRSPGFWSKSGFFTAEWPEGCRAIRMQAIEGVTIDPYEGGEEE